MPESYVTLHPMEARTTKPPAALRRWFPLYCLLIAVVTFGYALWDTFQLDGDAINYMDLGDYLRAGNWPAVVNGYWHPMYPAFLSLGHTLFHATLATELRAYYFTNYGIFVLEMLAICCFTDALVRLRERTTRTQPSPDYLLEKYALRYLGLALLVIASQRELSLGKIRPDALLQTFLLFAFAALLQNLRTERIRDAALMGAALGCAYLTKSFAFVLTFLCVGALIAFRSIWLRHSLARIAASAAVALVCFGVLAGPYIAALSRQHGRLDFGDSGSLNYAWYVGGTEKMHLQSYMTSEFGSADVHLQHPEHELLRSPQVLSYEQHPYGTNPDWFDTTYWNEGVKPHFNLRGELTRGTRNCVLVIRYLFNHPEALVLLALLFALGARAAFGWRPAAASAFWLVPIALGILIWAIYATVNTEERYVTVAYLTLILTVFATLRTSRGSSLQLTASALVVLLGLLSAAESLRVVFENRRQLGVIGLSRGWQNPTESNAAQALESMGLKPGDTVACVGAEACLGDYYWARLAQLRIVSEIYDPYSIPAYEYLATMPNRDRAIDAIRSTGAKVLVADFAAARVTPADPAMQQWRQLGQSTLYELPLNLPPNTEPHTPPPPPPRKPAF
ncbi:MAG TPA: hypothetical protein VHU44_19005 [Acidobacteriaceae bacterium]|nr:hypothetical protein [Acidobacteriaceae bacterium]